MRSLNRMGSHAVAGDRPQTAGVSASARDLLRDLARDLDQKIRARLWAHLGHVVADRRSRECFGGTGVTLSPFVSARPTRRRGPG